MAFGKYVVKNDGMVDRFRNSRNEIQVIGGGFGNGKTAAVCVRALELARQYPGSNGLMARSTYPKLNDTLRKEFLKWCPKSWIKSFPMSNNGSNTCTLTNGSTINFRYIQQSGAKGNEQSTSNLLSATYDWAIVDQVEDPEIVEKDFLDLLGRMRGMAPYIGDDPTMPRQGPQWMILTCNPTRNWFYKKIIRPLHLYQQTGTITDELLCRRGPDGKPVLDENGKPRVLVDLFEGSTYENAHVLDERFIQRLESLYTGQMKDRFLLGNWGAYEGLVYPTFNELIHGVEESEAAGLVHSLKGRGYDVNYFEGYDFGIAQPSCYGLWFVDNDGNVVLLDGFYQKELGPNEQTDKIIAIRSRWDVPADNDIFADPAIFRRYGGVNINETVATAFERNGLRMRRANNDIMAGVVKAGSYLHVGRFHRNPFTGSIGAPHLYVNRKLSWFFDEIGNYYWTRDGKGDIDDKPMDKNDHAMDMMRFSLTDVPAIAVQDPAKVGPPAWMEWQERELRTGGKDYRHGR